MLYKTDLKDVTFLIPLRLDSIERLENLVMVVEFLSDNFDTNIHVLEATKFNNKILSKILPERVDITFTVDYDPIFYRTHYINQMVMKCDTPYVAIWDADVIVSKEQIMEAVTLLRNNEFDFVLPYKNKFMDTSEIIRALYYEDRDFNVLVHNEAKMKSVYNPNPVGGGFFANRQTYIKAGLENKKFYGWGTEDGERVKRWTILGYKIEQLTGVIYHFTHRRFLNSKFHATEQQSIKFAEWLNVVNMSKQQLKEEVKSWNTKI